MNPRAVNPDEGQVAIPWAAAADGYAVGRLGARAMRWVEESLGESIDDVYRRIAEFVHSTGDLSMPVRVAAVILWAGLEHERRATGGDAHHGAYTLDDVDDIIEAEGIDDAFGYALALIQLSSVFRKRSEQLDAHAKAHGVASPMDPLKAAAIEAAVTAGNGTSQRH